MSADSKRPQALVASGRVTVSAVQTYAVGHLALVGNINGLSDPQLMAAGNRVAIAEPDIAPYGRAAKQLLEQAGLSERFATIKTADLGPGKPDPYLLGSSRRFLSIEQGTELQ